jgi:putative transposase
VPVELPRDREGSFEPQLVPKHQRRFAGFDDKIVSMYARGMSTREISKHLEEIYGVEVGRDTISLRVPETRFAVDHAAVSYW